MRERRRGRKTLRMSEWEWQHCLECFCLHRLIFVVGFHSSPFSYLPLTERNEKEDSQWGYLVARMLCLCISIWVCAGGFPSSRWWENAGQGFLFFKSCHFLLLTLLSVANAWQTRSRNVWESIRDYRQQRMKTYKVFHTWCQDPVPSPYSSPLLGSQGLQQPECLPEGQSHSGRTAAALLWCLCVVTSCLTSTLINFVNDRSMWARRRVGCFKITTYWLDWAWTGFPITQCSNRLLEPI